IPSRLSILTKSINKDRGECFYCAQCGRSCKIYADFSSSSALIIPALRTGNVDLITDSMVREVLVDKEGLATGVSYVHKPDMQEYQVSGRTVVLAASACESARLLLNSKSPQHPNGLANSSNVVGKYLHDSTGADMGGIIPELFDRKRYNEDGTGGMHLYTPWWLDNKKLDFPRGYHIEPSGGRRMPSAGFGSGIHSYATNDPAGHPQAFGGYGQQLKNDYRRLYGATVNFAGRGEMVPNKDTYCEIDPTVVDKWGIPVLRFHFKFSDYEYNQAKHMQETFRSIITEMGGTPFGPMPTAEQGYGIEAGGRIIHEAGVTRMGNDPSTSVLNKYCQAHDCRNVFVADGGPFVSQADKNCTWTILALAMRTGQYIADQRKAGTI